MIKICRRCWWLKRLKSWLVLKVTSRYLECRVKEVIIVGGWYCINIKGWKSGSKRTGFGRVYRRSCFF